MRLCFVGDGASPHIESFIKAFSKRHEVHLVTENPLIRPDVSLHLVHGKGVGIPAKVFQIRRAIRSLKPDVVHAHYICGYGTYAAMTGYHPLILSPWGSDIVSDPKTTVKRWMVKYALARADIVVALSDMMEYRLLELGCNPSKIRRMEREWVDGAIFHSQKPSLSLRESLSVNGPLVLTTRPIDVSQFYTLLMALELVVKKHPDAKLVMTYTKSDEESRKAISRLADDLHIAQSVIDVGYVPHERMSEYISTADVFVDPFISSLVTRQYGLHDGIGVAALEAMACGIPVLILRGVSDFCPCYTCSPFSYEDMGQAILQLIDDQKLKQLIVSRQMAYVKESASMEKAVQEWETIYKMLEAT